MRSFLLLSFLFSSLFADSRLVGVLDTFSCHPDTCHATMTIDGQYVKSLWGSPIYKDILSQYQSGDLLEAVCGRGGPNAFWDCVFRIRTSSTPTYNQKKTAERTSTIVIGELYDKPKK